LDLRGSIPAFILITDGKYHDSNTLDHLVPIPEAIYVVDKAYVDFAALHNINVCGSYYPIKCHISYMIISPSCIGYHKDRRFIAELQTL